MEECETLDTAIIEKANGDADNRELSEEEQETHQGITGCFIYLAYSILYDITYGVMAVAQRMNNVAIQEDVKSVKGVLRYIQGKSITGDQLQEKATQTGGFFRCILRKSNSWLYMSAPGHLSCLLFSRSYAHRFILTVTFNYYYYYTAQPCQWRQSSDYSS